MKDPRHAYKKPPFPQKRQQPTGTESAMTPRPDYGRDSYRGHGRLLGKSALITGGDSGIGRAVALAFAREGADVAFTYLESETDAQETFDVLHEENTKRMVLKGDIREEAVCIDFIEQTIRKFGKLNILVNNAAYQMARDSILDIPAQEFDRVMKTNIYGMFYLTKAAFPYLSGSGSVITTASVQAYDPSSELLHYAMTKAAQVNFTKALAQEGAKKGIRVNAVAPGPIWTPLIAYSFEDSKTQQFGKQAPLKRPGQPVEVAPVYVFLASDEASYITGQIYGVTGGEPLMCIYGRIVRSTS